MENRGEEEMNVAGSGVNSRIGRENWEGEFSRGAATEAFSFVCAQRCFVESASVFSAAMFCRPRFTF